MLRISYLCTSEQKYMSCMQYDEDDYKQGF